MMTPSRIGAATTPLQLKHTQPQQLLAAAVLPPQQLAASCYVLYASTATAAIRSLYLLYCYSNC